MVWCEWEDGKGITVYVTNAICSVDQDGISPRFTRSILVCMEAVGVEGNESHE